MTENEVGSEYETKKQFMRKLPSKTVWTRASNACHVNSIRVLMVAVGGRIRAEAAYAPATSEASSSSERTVVASISGLLRGIGGGGACGAEYGVLLDDHEPKP